MPATAELVQKKLADVFPDAGARAEAKQLLSRYGTQSWHNETHRVRLACLKLCAGDLQQLAQAVSLADCDYRDALVAAESPNEYGADLNATPAKLTELRQRDRAQYDAWLNSNTPQV